MYSNHFFLVMLWKQWNQFSSKRNVYINIGFWYNMCNCWYLRTRKFKNKFTVPNRKVLPFFSGNVSQGPTMQSVKPKCGIQSHQKKRSTNWYKLIIFNIPAVVHRLNEAFWTYKKECKFCKCCVFPLNSFNPQKLVPIIRTESLWPKRCTEWR